MLKFCPYDFADINVKNLAYELVFPKKWDWDKIKKETVVGDPEAQGLDFIELNDQRKEEHFKIETTTEVVMLLESEGEGEESGFDIFLRYLTFKNKKLLEKRERQETKLRSGESSEDMMEGAKGSNEGEFQYNRHAFRKNREIKPLYHKKINGIDTFVDDHNNIMMYALACCPTCHNRLPIGWDVAEDFGGVSLMAPSGGGKTTFLLSMMYDNWRAFQHIGGLQSNGHTLRITAAHFLEDVSDVTYNAMRKQADRMCRDGLCPDNTDRENWIPPVFLNIQYDKHTMILGIYDNAGENLREMNLIENPNLQMLIDKMFAEMFLFDPKDLYINLPKDKDKIIHEQYQKCELLSLEEQGKLQMENQGEKILGKTLLESTPIKVQKDRQVSKAMEVYRKHTHSLAQKKAAERLKQMYFFGIIIKSDLLEQAEEVNFRQEYRVLFNRELLNDMLDKNCGDMRSGLVENMIKELGLFGEKNIDDFKVDFGEIGTNGEYTGRQSVSWHCISALGCDADAPEDGGKLLGEYAPIRVAEPLVKCILKRVADNGWME